MGPVGLSKVEPLLESADPQQRVLVYRALRRAGRDALSLAAKLVRDPSPAVRREIALSLRDVPEAQSVPLLVALAEQFDGKDRAYLEALGLGCEGKESAVFAAAAKLFGPAPRAWTPQAEWIAWRLHPVQAVQALKARATDAGLNLEQRHRMLTALAFVGFGLPETYAQWGWLFDDGMNHLNALWISVSMFVVMVSILLLVTFVGEALREAFDPKKFSTYQ
jgi:hypothetical protein